MPHCATVCHRVSQYPSVSQRIPQSPTDSPKAVQCLPKYNYVSRISYCLTSSHSVPRRESQGLAAVRSKPPILSDMVGKVWSWPRMFTANWRLLVPSVPTVHERTLCTLYKCGHRSAPMKSAEILHQNYEYLRSSTTV